MQVGLPRFLWFFAAMATCIGAACFCYREQVFTLICACAAGFATQHSANKFTLLLSMIPVAEWMASQSMALHALFEVLIFSYVYLIIYLIFGRKHTAAGRGLS